MSTLRVPLRSSDHVLGDINARCVVVEYGDYECPHCAAAQPHVRQVLRDFSGWICFAFRHFPLTEVHPNAEAAAESAEFAGAHSRFWPMHELLFANQARLGRPVILTLADSLGLSVAALSEALANGTYAAKVQADFMGGVRSGVNGTPSFFINGRRHDGTYDFPSLEAAINAWL
jgi:protein-disulfide isomerase